MTARPHDALFRSAFEQPADAAAELRHVLPGEIAERFRARLIELAPTTEAMVMRYSERLIAEGEARGRERGRLEAQRDILRTQLSSKFGPLDASVQARIDTAAEPELQRWLERIVVDGDLDAVFRDDLH